MKHAYLLIEADDVLDTSSKFFKVWVPSSQQGLRDFLCLVAYAADNNFYFVSWSSEAADFLSRVAESVGYTLASLPLVQSDARNLVRAIKARTHISAAPHVVRNCDYVRRAIDDNYFFKHREALDHHAKRNT